MRDRRSALRQLAVAGGVLASAAVLGAAGPAFAADKELHVLNWQGWGTDQPFAIADFEKASGYKIVHDYITSFSEMFTKLKTNPGYYDVVDINTARTPEAIKDGLIEPIDVSVLKNYGDIFEDMRKNPLIQQDGKIYGVPWIWGSTSLTYDTEVYKTPPTSIQALWDPKVAGRVCWVDRADDSVRFAAIASGQDPENIQDMDKVKERLRALKPQIKAFWKSEDEWLKLVAAKECDISTIWTDSTEKAKELNKLPVTFFVPDEGSLAWRDALSIPANAPHREAALAFIDYLTGKDFYAQWAKAGGAPVAANSAALGALSEGSLTRKVLGDPKVIARLHFEAPVSDETRQKYVDLWEETKAYYAQ